LRHERERNLNFWSRLNALQWLMSAVLFNRLGNLSRSCGLSDGRTEGHEITVAFRNLGNLQKCNFKVLKM